MFKHHKSKLAAIVLLTATLTLGSCQKEKYLNLSPSTVSVHQGETSDAVKIKSNYETLNHEIEDTFIADIAIFVSNGFDGEIEIKGLHVGKTNLRLFNDDVDMKFPIEVIGNYNTFSEPPIDFDDTRDSIKAKLGTPLLEDFPIDDTTRAYVYSDSVAERLFVLFFESSINCKTYALLFNDENVTLTNELQPFLEERYKFYTTAGDSRLYIDAKQAENAKKAVALSHTNNNHTVMYVDAKWLFRNGDTMENLWKSLHQTW